MRSFDQVSGLYTSWIRSRQPRGFFAPTDQLPVGHLPQAVLHLFSVRAFIVLVAKCVLIHIVSGLG